MQERNNVRDLQHVIVETRALTRAAVEIGKKKITKEISDNTKRRIEGKTIHNCTQRRKIYHGSIQSK